ncbi:MAG: YwiC-like family protein [Polyangiaceae bacterium]
MHATTEELPLGTQRAPARKPSLWPKEHGAYGQLGVPLVAGLLVSREPSLAAILIAVSACTAFVAHESLLVLLGHRGPRAKRELGGAAVRRLAALGITSTSTLAIAVLLVPALLVPLAMVVATAAVLGHRVSRKAEKTLFGEIVAGAALSGAGFLASVAAHVDLRLALSFWIAWTLGLACGTAAVRYVVFRFRLSSSPFKGVFDRAATRPSTGARTSAEDARASALGAGAVLAVSTTAAAVLAGLGARGVIATLPLLLAAWGIVIARPSPKSLRRVGWALVGATVATALCMVLPTHLGG